MSSFQINQLLSDGTLKIIHPETLAKLVKFSDGNIETYLNDVITKANTNALNITAATTIANNALNIAQGKSKAVVFDTFTEMVEFLQDTSRATKDFFNIGDNLLILQTTVPDYWISAKSEQQANYETTETFQGTSGSIGNDYGTDANPIIRYSGSVTRTIGTGYEKVVVSSISPLSAEVTSIEYDKISGSTTIRFRTMMANSNVTITLLCTKTTAQSDYGYYSIAELETRKTDLEPYQKKKLLTNITTNGVTNSEVEAVLNALNTYLKEVVDGTKKVAKSSEADSLSIPRTISLNGDASGTVSFDGSEDVAITVTLPNIVTSGAYSVVQVDSKGRVTAGGQLIEIGATGVTQPSDNLATGGLFFKEI